MSLFSYSSCFGRVSMLLLSSYCVSPLLPQKMSFNWYYLHDLRIYISAKTFLFSPSLSTNKSCTSAKSHTSLLKKEKVLSFFVQNAASPQPHPHQPPPTTSTFLPAPPPPPKHVLQPGLLCRFTQTKIAAAWRTIWSTLAQAL